MTDDVEEVVSGWRDVKRLEVTDHCHITLKSELLHTELSAVHDDLETGLTVHRDGEQLAISAGTLEGATPDFHTYHGLSVEQARALGEALLDAADDAEAALEAADSIDEPESSLLRRLIE